MIAGGAAGGAPLEVTPARSGPAERRQPTAPGWPFVARTAAATTLDRPAAWLIALGGFMARGGIVLLAFPIVALPTPTGISNVLAPIITSLALTGPSTELLLLIVGLLGISAIVLIAAVFLGVVADVSLIRWAAQAGRSSGLVGAVRPAAVEPGDQSALPPTSVVLDRTPVRRLWSMLLARLLAYLPLAVALAVGVGRLGAAVYHELILPDDLATPLVLRVIREEPWTVIAIAVAWIVGETLGGLAERAIVLDGASVPRSIARAIWHVLRWPFRSLLSVLATLAAFLLVLAPTLIAAGAGWDLLAGRLRSGGVDVVTGLGSVALVAVWVGGLVLVGAAATWRSVLWTFEALARRAAA